MHIVNENAQKKQWTRECLAISTYFIHQFNNLFILFIIEQTKHDFFISSTRDEATFFSFFRFFFINSPHNQKYTCFCNVHEMYAYVKTIIIKKYDVLFNCFFVFVFFVAFKQYYLLSKANPINGSIDVCTRARAAMMGIEKQYIECRLLAIYSLTCLCCRVFSLSTFLLRIQRIFH